MLGLKIAALVLAFVGLFFAYGLSKWVGSLGIEHDDMKEISKKIKEGSKVFLLREYKSMLTFVLILFVIISLGIGWKVSVTYVAGTLLAMLSGYFGVQTATKGNAGTASVAMTDGIKQATKVAFRSGAVMGLCAAGLGLVGIATVYLIFGTDSVYYVIAFALGVSTVSLISRIGGGIYVKASDVGSEIVGRIELDMQADDPRNPAIIADNVGKSVGGVAAIGLDMMESYISAIAAAIAIAAIMPTMDPEFGAAFSISAADGMLFPVVLAAIGIFSSVVGIFVVQGGEKSDPAHALTKGFLVGTGLVMVAAFVLSAVLFGNLYCGGAVAVGILAGIGVGKSINVYTSDGHKNFQKLIAQSDMGAGTLTVSGIGLGMLSTLVPILCIAGTIVIANYFAGIYGVALAAVGMTANMAMSVAVNASSPIASNAHGIVQTTDTPDETQKVTKKLGFIGLEIIKTERGISIASAAVTALALFIVYIQVINISGGEQYAGFSLSMLNPMTLAGMLIGGMIPFIISALTMNSVGKAARQMIVEVRRQFREHADILAGTGTPDYAKCVDISTKAAVNEMLFPGIIVMVAPILVGLLLGCEALGGMIAGAFCSGVLLSIMMVSSGEAWNNVKDKVEYNTRGRSADESYKAAVAGDLLGDAFRDISGPAINIVIKLMAIVSVTFAFWFIKVGGLIYFL